LVNHTDNLIEEKSGAVLKDPQLEAIEVAVVRRVFEQAVADKPLDQQVVVNLYLRTSGPLSLQDNSFYKKQGALDREGRIFSRWQTVKTDTFLVPCGPCTSVVPIIGDLFSGGQFGPRSVVYIIR
jgi:hypothetical protein